MIPDDIRVKNEIVSYIGRWKYSQIASHFNITREEISILALEKKKKDRIKQARKQGLKQNRKRQKQTTKPKQTSRGHDSPEYIKYMKSPQWEQLRARVIKRDAGKCTRCGGSGNDVHHLHYRNWKHEELEDLVLLCRECHSKLHKTKTPIFPWSLKKFAPKTKHLTIELSNEVYDILKKCCGTKSYTEFLEGAILDKAYSQDGI